MKTNRRIVSASVLTLCHQVQDSVPETLAEKAEADVTEVKEVKLCCYVFMLSTVL